MQRVTLEFSLMGKVYQTTKSFDLWTGEKYQLRIQPDGTVDGAIGGQEINPLPFWLTS